MELGFAEGRPRDVWRRLRFVIDQARAWADATGGNLRQYLAWVGQQTAEGARVAESILPETDDDAVRMMTIHGAKGLEFPITIVSGMSTVPASPRGEPEVVFPATGAVGYKVGPGLTTSEYDAWAPIDEQMGLHERIRLLYVACTRARDHLVVSVYRKDRAKAPDPSNRTNAELLLDGMGRLVDEAPDAVEPADGIAVAVVLLSFITMITRRKAMSQVVGFLSMENGLFFGAMSATYGMPMIVEFGVALDVLVAVLVLGIFFFQIREQFDSLDLHNLESLKEPGAERRDD